MTIYKLGELGEFKGGISTLNKEEYDKGVLFVNYMDVFKNPSIKSSKNLRLYNATENDYLKHNIIYGDAMFTASSEKPEEIATSSIYLLDEKAILNGFCKRYRFDHSILNPLFASYLFRTFSFRKNAESFATGFTRYNISQKDLSKIQVDIPSIEEQQKIIDIIEPIEKLYLKYPNIVDISNFESAKKDIKKLIDIIEPIEELENNIKNTIEILKLILINLYNLSDNCNLTYLSEYIKLINSKYENQKNYFATNAISEFGIDESKKSSICIQQSIPSRANVTPKKKSFIISKLSGENKIMFFNEKPKEVFSTGFFNFETNHIDHISGFILSNAFKEQKEMYSTGTTMRGITNSSLGQIKIKKPLNSNGQITEILIKLIELNNKISSIKNKKIKLLIK